FTGADTRPRPELYRPFAQSITGSPYLIVQGTAAALTELPAAIRQTVARRLPGQLVDRIDRFESLLDQEVASQRLSAWLFGLFAALAVGLGAIGLGATLAWS